MEIPNEVIVWKDKEHALDDLGKYKETITCYDKAIMINPKCNCMG